MDSLLAFLEAREAGPAQEVVWSGGALRLWVTLYLTPTMPPLSAVTSARAVVLRPGQVMVAADPEAEHILPGGRLEPGETPAAAVAREVLEETGWEVSVGRLLGFLHFRHLGPAPADHPLSHPHFLQVVYLAWPVAYRPESRQTEGYELWAEFRRLHHVWRMGLAPAERALLRAALSAEG
jgi:8-oxo-dGTP pyrophosphatase MutT (NUDIX family)